MTMRPIIFHAADNACIAMLHESPTTEPTLGLMIVVGGPQYRLGAHRQYLTTARTVAQNGFPVFRFDWCGVGDSDGQVMEIRDLGPELIAAVKAFQKEAPHIKGIVLWGLCEGASIILSHGPKIPDLQGTIIANPWIDDAASHSRARIKNYYLKRFWSKSFWRALFSGKVGLIRSARHAGKTIRQSLKNAETSNLAQEMLKGACLARAILHIASGRDQVNHSFEQAVKHNKIWQNIIQGPTWKTVYLKDADHVFSRPHHQKQVEEATLSFLRNRLDLIGPDLLREDHLE